MREGKEKINDSLDLRKRAEALLHSGPETMEKLPSEDIQELVHELQVHQIELEMQNEELRKVQLELEESRDKYFDLYNFAPCGYVTLDRKGYIVDTNLVFARQLGEIERQQLIGKALHGFMAPENRDLLHLHIREVFETGIGRNCELKLLKKDGQLLYVQMENLPVADENGNVNQVRAAIIDVTHRKLVEQERDQLKAKLRVAQRMKAIATLAGGIAHEFNNALSVITGNLDLLQMKSRDENIIDRVTGPMKRSVDRMAKLTVQLLAYARGGKYQAQSISFSQFTRNTLPFIRHSVDPSVRIDTDFAANIFDIKADHIQMQLVLSALLSNASDAVKGKGHIRISTRNEEIDAAFSENRPGLKPGSYVCFTIEDTGTGMDAETRHQIFQPFFSTKFQGRGLGMAAVYGIVKNHDGWISVDSEMGKGTRVKIYLPAIEAPELEPEKPKAEPHKGAGTILLIEDDEMVSEVTQSLLEKMGYRVLGALTGKEALEIARNFDGNIDIAILDFILSDIDAMSIYLRLIEYHAGLKVIVCSGYAVDKPVQEILEAGAQGFLQKPYSFATLSQILKDVSEKVKNPGPQDLALVCPLEGALHDSALFNAFMECWSTGVLEYWKNKNPTPIFCNFKQRPSGSLMHRVHER